MEGKKKAIEKLHYIMRGVDQEECESDVGWWENRGGAYFGANVLTDLEALINEIFER